jgi:hypothetical protein
MATKKAIVVESLSKSFRLPHEQHSGLKQLLLGLSRGKINRGYEEIAERLNAIGAKIEVLKGI